MNRLFSRYYRYFKCNNSNEKQGFVYELNRVSDNSHTLPVLLMSDTLYQYMCCTEPYYGI